VRRRITGFRKTGHIYGSFEDRPLYEYKCTILSKPHLDGIHDGCCHFECRLESLRQAGFPDVAAKLAANAEAKDWLRNWGKMVYDPEYGYGGPERRKMAAQFMRALRNKAVSYGNACASGAWAGALLTK